jgi:radical SAM superfamily enzyme YgiQ (UPF0313 family)
MKNILLYDVDSLLPNIALMKLSTFHKNNGDKIDIIKGNAKPVEINYEGYDSGYASVIFTKNISLINNFPFDIGGVGYSLKKELPKHIEHLMPDYSLYPENEYSIGYTTRGCARKCSFCFVPKKEGTIKFNTNIEEFYNPNLKKIMLLDNNIFAYKEYSKVFKQLMDINKPSCFKQGMDFRLIDNNKIDCLLSIKYDKEFIFAYDSMNIQKTIEEKMQKYRHRFKDWSLKFFVLVGYDTTLEEDIFRINYLKEHKCLPYVMRYENCYKSPNAGFYNDLAAYCNQVWVIKSMSFEEMVQRRHVTQKRIDYSINLWKKLQQ